MEEATRFEDSFSVKLPDEMRVAYALMDGSEHSTDARRSWIRFWRMQEFQPSAALPLPHDMPSLPCKPFVFADFGYECVYYVIELEPSSSCFGQVFAPGATRTVQIAESFDEFLRMVVEDDEGLHAYF
ncbi:SMI1/KNR4 family protein [Variovorax sp. GB1P17]|uniref:SMI1/KNR4 family protein n=1 Tax=Variovorax sp. GB1P17 TaxID=3443740 RepID=UPI003F471E0B